MPTTQIGLPGPLCSMPFDKSDVHFSLTLSRYFTNPLQENNSYQSHGAQLHSVRSVASLISRSSSFLESDVQQGAFGIQSMSFWRRPIAFWRWLEWAVGLAS